MMEHNISINGRRYLLTSDDDYLRAEGAKFERHMVSLFKSLIRPSDVVLDIGANIGLTAILFSGLAKKVIAFEISPSTFLILKENLLRAQANNVSCHAIGLGDKSEVVSISFAQNNRSMAFVSLLPPPPGGGYVVEKVQIDTLDNYIKETGENLVNFIKIDIEGFEMRCLKGMTKTLAKMKPIVVLELNHYCLDALHRITVPDYFDFLLSIFPYAYAVDGDNSQILDLRDEKLRNIILHEHIMHQRFPNIVCSYDSGTEIILRKLEYQAKRAFRYRAKLCFCALAKRVCKKCMNLL